MEPTRRRYLRVAGAPLLASALAGCPRSRTGGERPPFLSEYRETIVDELDVAIERLAVEAGTVSLRYTSSFETGTEELGYEIGFIGGRFGRQVAEGWDVDRLAATVGTADGRTLSWSVTAETARAFATDEITVDEFVDRVFGTLTVE